MIILLMTLQAACSSPAPKPAVARDTALFVYRDGLREMKQHGDTVWSTSGNRTTRIVDDGRRITIVRAVGTDSSTTEWCVRGDQAISADGSSARSVPVAQLRLIRTTVEKARVGQAILGKIP
jgi:hypothetical protein